MLSEFLTQLLDNSLVGSALGGFLGVCIFFIVRFIFAWFRSKPQPIATYLCAHTVNQGQATESFGQLMHHHGKAITEESEYKKLGAKNPIWEWTREPVGLGRGESVFYGPYTTDAVEPGLYKAIFSIKTIGMMSKDHIESQLDVPLLELDINRSRDETSTAIVDDGAYGPRHFVTPYQSQQRMSRRYIRASDLARDGWQEFELQFYSDGTGIWEYRALAYDGQDKNGTGTRPDNISQFSPKDKLRILFDRVSIVRVNKLALPWT